MPTTNTLPIVGAFYRPPAKAILDSLPIGTPLTLQAEPSNQYDPNAVAVYISDVLDHLTPEQQANLGEKLEPFGFSLDDLANQSVWHLGYIPKEMAAVLKATGQIGDEDEMLVEFSTAANGAPRVRRTDPFEL